MNNKATFTPDPHLRSWVDVVFPYDADYVQAIKDTVPGSHRSWDPKRKLWSIHCAYEDRLRKAFDWIEFSRTDTYKEDKARQERARQDRQRQQQQQRQQRTQPNPTTAVVSIETVLVDLFRLLPAPLAPKAHKALARVVHPDTGGDTEICKALNNAWDRTRQGAAA